MQLVYLNFSEELHTVNNQIMATIILFILHLARGQSPQNFWEQFNAIRQVCDQWGLHIGQTGPRAKAVI